MTVKNGCVVMSVERNYVNSITRQIIQTRKGTVEAMDFTIFLTGKYASIVISADRFR